MKKPHLNLLIAVRFLPCTANGLWWYQRTWKRHRKGRLVSMNDRNWVLHATLRRGTYIPTSAVLEWDGSAWVVLYECIMIHPPESVKQNPFDVRPSRWRNLKSSVLWFLWSKGNGRVGAILSSGKNGTEDGVVVKICKAYQKVVVARVKHQRHADFKAI